MTEDAILKDLQVAYEYAYQHDDWVAPIMEELATVTLQEATWRPTSDSKNIWEIVLHVATWNENIVHKVRTGENVRPADGHWPDPDAEANDATWATAKERLSKSLDLIADMLKTTTIDQILASPYGMPDILVRYIHIGYHSGQITKIREFYASRT